MVRRHLRPLPNNRLRSGPVRDRNGSNVRHRNGSSVRDRNGSNGIEWLQGRLVEWLQGRLVRAADEVRLAVDTLEVGGPELPSPARCYRLIESERAGSLSDSELYLSLSRSGRIKTIGADFRVRCKSVKVRGGNGESNRRLVRRVKQLERA